MAAMLLLAAMLAAAAPSATDEAAIFKAAGFKKQATVWKSGECVGMEGESYQPGKIETYKDINGDGRPDAVVTEGSGICYGNTGTRFWLLTKEPNGTWKRMISEIGIPEFVPTRKGRAGWPSLSIRGPGLCFPVYRWNGRVWELYTFEYEGKRCRNP
jgi:hypothetical protein